MTLSEKISSLRVENGLTRAEAARRIGVSSDSLAGWEKGRIPRSDHIEALARVFQTDVIELHKLREAAKQKQEALKAETTEALPDAAQPPEVSRSDEIERFRCAAVQAMSELDSIIGENKSTQLAVKFVLRSIELILQEGKRQ